MKISDAEHELMQILWQEDVLTVGQVIERVQTANDWHENTIKTMLTRLVKKGIVSRQKDGGRFFYRALVSQTEFLTYQSEGLLAKFFDGRMAPLIAHFASQDKLSKEDRAEIEAILENMRSGNG